MGFLRKALSVSTVGTVDFLSDKERTARSARLTKQAARKGNRLTERQVDLAERDQWEARWDVNTSARDGDGIPFADEDAPANNELCSCDSMGGRYGAHRVTCKALAHD